MTQQDLYWQNDQTPASHRYDDIYFSTDDGLQESRHVFLKGISAPKIWQNKKQFTLLENGFGTGLNFVATCHEWLKTTSRDNSCLTYIATEKHPLSKADIAQALSNWPELHRETQALLDKYPPLMTGFHQIDVIEGRVKLLLLLGDCTETLPQVNAQVDGFYLDGFTPTRNPDMWTQNIFGEIARLATPQARLATFTSAGHVRRGLTSAGFSMEKVQGFGKKRDSLTGTYNGPPQIAAKPWFNRPPPLDKGASVAIIGGGIAGMAAGLALQKSGYQVTIYDQADAPMQQASGNPAGILDPFLNRGQSLENIFYRSALCHALDYYTPLDPDIFLFKGLTKIPADHKEHQKYGDIFQQGLWPRDMMELGEGNKLYFPTCGALSPPKLKKIFSEQLSLKCGVSISHMEYDQGWHLYTPDNQSFNADAVLITAGVDSCAYSETTDLPLDPVRGQISFLKAQENTPVPSDVLCGKGYLIPPVPVEGNPTIITGATFDRHDTESNVRDSDHEENISHARSLWPDIGESAVIGGRASIRAYCPDHLPICGAVPNVKRYHQSYRGLKHGPTHQEFDPAPYHPNLYIMAGLGARGFMTAPLLADLMVALFTGETLPVSQSVYEALHPGRFQIRRLIKGL